MGGNLEKDLKSEGNSGDLEKDWNFNIISFSVKIF